MRFLLLFLTHQLVAQIAPCTHPNIPVKPESIPHLMEINRDIWTPFSQSWATNDVTAYNDLHAPGFIRATGGKWQEVCDLETYTGRNRKGFEKRAAEQQTNRIDFAFFERIAGDSIASERGIYRVVRSAADGTTREYYGRFHCFHKKSGGRWRIAVDYDSDDGSVVTKSDFEAARMPDEF